MSLIDQIKQVIRCLLDDGEPHTLDEIKAAVAARHIVVPPKSSALRTAIYNLRKFDGYLQRVEPGVYQRVGGPGQAPQPLSAQELRALLPRLEATLAALGAFNWITCSDQQLLEARDTVTLLKKLSAAARFPAP